MYYQTNLTVLQIGPLFGISKYAVDRVIHLGPLVALAPVTGKHSPETVLIVDGTLVSTHDRTVAARSKNYRHSTNVQVVIDANTLMPVTPHDRCGTTFSDDPGGLDRHPVRSAIRWSDRGGRAIMVGMVRDRV